MRILSLMLLLAPVLTFAWEQVSEFEIECEKCQQCGGTENKPDTLGKDLSMTECLKACFDSDQCNYVAYAKEGGICHSFETCSEPPSADDTDTSWDVMAKLQDDGDDDIETETETETDVADTFSASGSFVHHGLLVTGILLVGVIIAGTYYNSLKADESTHPLLAEEV